MLVGEKRTQQKTNGTTYWQNVICCFTCDWLNNLTWQSDIFCYFIRLFKLFMFGAACCLYKMNG